MLNVVLLVFPVLSQLMVTDDILTASVYLSVQDVPDFSVQEALNQVQLNLYITALYIAVTLCITVTEKLPKNSPLYLLLS